MKVFFLLLTCFFFALIDARADDYPKTIKLSDDKEITIKEKPKRIFIGYVGALEITMKLVDKEKIIAAPKLSTNKKYSNCVDYAKDLPLLYKSLNVELIEKENPDLIILASFNDPKFLALLKKFKRNYIIIDSFNSYEDIKSTTTLLGKVLGEEKKAKELNAKMDEDLKAVKAKHPKKKVKVMSYGYSRYSAGLNTTFDDMVELAGAINVTAENGIKGHKNISHEKLLVLNPEVIILLSSDEDAKEKFLKEYSSKAVFKMVKAIKNKKIILLNPAYGNSTSQFFVKGVESLNEKLYPEQ